MSEQEKKKIVKKNYEKEKDEVAPNPQVVEKGKKIKNELDKLMDKIDDVLEENAEAFVKSYIQKGGE